MEKKPNILILLVAIVLSCFFSGWILKNMWAWFIAPLGVMPLSLAHAIGLDSLFTIYLYQSRKNNNDNQKSEWYLSLAGIVLVNLTLLLIGFVAHSFM